MRLLYFRSGRSSKGTFWYLLSSRFGFDVVALLISLLGGVNLLLGCRRGMISLELIGYRSSEKFLSFGSVRQQRQKARLQSHEGIVRMGETALVSSVNSMDKIPSHSCAHFPSSLPFS